MPTTIESLELQVQQNATSAVSGIDSLSASLSRLKNAVKGGVGLNSVANQVRNLDTALKSVDGSSAGKIDKLADSLSKLKGLGNIKLSSSIGNQLKNISSAAASLNTADLSGLNKLSSALQPLNNISKASGLKSVITQLQKLPQLTQALNGINWVTFSNQLRQLSNSLAPLANQLNTVSNAFSRLPTNIRRVVTATNALPTANNRAATSYINLWAKFSMAIQAVRTGARVIASWITESNSYIENLNLFNVSMGEYASEARKYAEQVGELMGIDPSEWMRNQGIFNTIITGFGVANDKAYIMSKNLTQLGYDLSSFFNISYADAMQKLQSGISGELEPLRRLGYDLSVARLQQEALNLGIEKSVTSMTQAEKSQLRYHAIMTQVTVAQGDMARTLNAPANQLRILQAQVTQCARAFGNIFIPVLNAVLPYAIALAKVIKMVANTIASFLGFELPEVDYSGVNSGASAVSNLANSAGNAGKGLGDAAKGAKKLKNALLGIDELNVISPNDYGMGNGTGGGSIGGSIGGGDLGFELPDYDFIGGLVTSKADEIVKMITDSLNEITAVCSGFLLAIGTILVVTGTNIPLGLGLMSAGAVGLASVVIANWDTMSKKLARVLTIITSVLSGFLLAIGAFLAFSGVNVPLGAGLMVAGVTSLVTAAVINWKFLNGDMKNSLSMLTGIVSGALLAMGALLTFTGVSVPLGVALMAAGAVGLVTVVGLNWDSMTKPMKNTIGLLEGIVGGALLTFGAILALTGVNIPLGVGMIAAGAVSLVSAVALNWDSLTGDLSSSITSITAIVSGALLGIGAILALTGVATGLGIGMLAVGAVGLAATVGLNWNSMTNEVRRTVTNILVIVGAAALAIGAILAFTGAGTALGVGLMLAGAASIGTAVSLNWDSLVDKIKGVVTKILAIAGAASLAIGLILVCTGVGIPLGVGLILAGAGSLGTAAAINWDTIETEVGNALQGVADKFVEFWKTMVRILGKIKESITTWAGNCKEFFTKGADGKNALDNIKEAAIEWGESFEEGFSIAFSNIKSWVKEHIISPIVEVIEESPVGQLVIGIKNNASEWWENAKSWWEDESNNDDIILETDVELVKKGWTSVGNWIGDVPNVSQTVSLSKNGWTTVKNWIGNIPIVNQDIELSKKGWTSVKNWIGNIPGISQGINLVKSGWQTIQSWIGNIPTLSQGIDLTKRGWTTVKNWIGNIPVLSQTIQLIKSGWSTVKNWIGNIPTLSQGIKLSKSGWSTVKSWIGNIPIVNQGISLIKSGWTSIKNWIGNHTTPVGISLFKDGWTSLSSWIGNKVSVGISLFKDGWTSIKKFFGLSGGGIVGADGGVKLFSSGGSIDSMGRGWWSSIPKYAKGTPSAGAHGSMFVAGENGAELVGHVNGTTEVLNRFQLAQVMKHSIVAGMAQFTGYWRNMTGQMTVCANGIIRSILVSTDMINANLATAGGYNQSNNLSHMVYEESQRGYDNRSDSDWSRSMRDFYHEYVEPTLKEIAADTKRQADKNEQTIVQVGNRTITDSVERQKNANGYSFTG